MPMSIEEYRLDEPLLFETSTQQQLVVRTVRLRMVRAENELQELRITLRLDGEAIRLARTSEAFHWSPDVDLDDGTFPLDADGPFELVIRPDGDTLAVLQEVATTAPSIGGYLLDLREEDPNHPTFYSENWYVTAVYTVTEQGRRGHRTLWHQERGTDLPPQNLYDTVRDFMIANEWPLQEEPQYGALITRFQGERGQWQCVAQVDEAERRIAFFSILPSRAPLNRRPLVAEYIARVNYDLFNGNFELDFGDGEVRFKTTLDAAGHRVGTAQLRNLLHDNVLTMNQHFLPLMELVLDEITVEQALQLGAT